MIPFSVADFRRFCFRTRCSSSSTNVRPTRPEKQEHETLKIQFFSLLFAFRKEQSSCSSITPENHADYFVWGFLWEVQNSDLRGSLALHKVADSEILPRLFIALLLLPFNSVKLSIFWILASSVLHKALCWFYVTHVFIMWILCDVFWGKG